MYRKASISVLHQSRHGLYRRNTAGATASSHRWLATKRQQRIAAEQAAATARDTTDATSKPDDVVTTPIIEPPPTTLIKTDLSQHVDWMETQRVQFDPLRPPPEQPDESGIVKRDLTPAMIDLTDIYDSRLHLDPQFDDSFEESTPLSQEMIQLLAVTNRPMTCAEYMRQALTHGLYGYYTNPTTTSVPENDNDWDDDWDHQDTSSKNGTAHAIIGPRGDFVTAPEVSQVFGECLAVWFVTQWKALGKPQSVQFVEVGPGKGTLMADMVRASIESFGYFGSKIERIHLVEASRAMREEQQARLQEVTSANWIFEKGNKESDTAETLSEANHDQQHNVNSDKPTIQVTWHDSFLDMVAATRNDDKLTSFVVCQEFMDALPVHVFEKTRDGWRERLVDVAVQPKEETSSENKKFEAAQEKLSIVMDKKPRLRFVVSPDTTPALRTLLNENVQESEQGQVVEVCPEAILLAQDIAKFLDDNNGAALIVDYGQEGSGDSLRGFSNHKQVHVLSRPGMVDVTADVDFAALRHAVNHGSKQKDAEADAVDPPQAFGPVTQGQFLASMGIVERVSQLIDDDRTSEKQANDLYMALERLVLPDQMGERYKVLAVSRKKEGMYPPAGFDAPRR